MIEDIVKRLLRIGERKLVPCPDNIRGCLVAHYRIDTDPDCAEAAVEIERLRAENERLREALQLAVPHLDDNLRFLRDIQAHSGNVTKAHDALTAARAALEEKK